MIKHYHLHHTHTNDTGNGIVLVCETLQKTGTGSVLCTIPVTNEQGEIDEILDSLADNIITVEHIGKGRRKKSRLVHSDNV